MWDAHCHLDDARFAMDLDAVLARARQVGVCGFVSAGVDPDGWVAQSEIARQHPDVHVAYGLHPWKIAGVERAELEVLLHALAEKLDGVTLARPVAIGELGLDRSSYTEKGSMEIQEKAFCGQLSLARERDLPVILHVVNTHARVLQLLKREGVPRRGGLIHAFSASPELAREFMKLGFYLSFGGAVTRPHAKRARTSAIEAVDSLLLCETDSPDLTPPAYPNTRNEPEALPLVLQSLAGLRGCSVEELDALTSQNTKTLFGIEE